MVQSKVERTTPSTPPVNPGGAGVVQWVAIAVAAAVSFAGLIGVAETQLHVFELRFNIYALLPLVAIAGNLVLLILISRLKNKTDDLVWFSLYVTCLVFLGVAEFFIRLSGGSDALLFWWPMSTLPLLFMPVMLFMFILSYTNPRQSRHVWTVASLFVATMLMAFFDLRTSILSHYTAAEIIPTPWNGAVSPGPYHAIVTVWILSLAALSLILLAGFYRRTLEPTLKKQAALFGFALLIPITAGAVTQGLLPELQIFNVLPLMLVLTAVSAGIITYGILRFRFLTLNPSLVAARILETINEAVLGVKQDLSVMYVNKGAERLLGYDPGQFSELRFANFLSQEWDDEMLKQALFNATSGRKSGQLDSIDLRTADGRVVTAKMSVSNVSEDGVLEGYLVVLTDISDLARAQETVERTVQERTREVQETKASLLASINSLKLGFVITDNHPEVIRVNTVAHDLFCPEHLNHLAADCQLVSMQGVQNLMGGSYSLGADVAICMKRQLPHEVKDVIFDDRSWRLYLSPMVVDRISIGCAVLFQETTQERLLERSRDEFFSIASHELRTPLTSIKGNSSLILQFYKKILKDATLKEMVSDIHESSDRLIEIVNDFLDVSRLEQGRIEFHLEQLSISKVIEEVVYGMNALLKQKGLHVKLSASIRQTDALPDVIVDKNRLKQILFNLLGNAVKFTKQGHIGIEAEVERDTVTIRVSDTGAGISVDAQKLLFRKFQQAGDSILTRDSTNGTGLGLYISRLLASGMDGVLGLEQSTLGKGSVFFLKVPAVTAARLKHMNEVVLAPDLKTGLLSVTKGDIKTSPDKV